MVHASSGVKSVENAVTLVPGRSMGDGPQLRTRRVNDASATQGLPLHALAAVTAMAAPNAVRLRATGCACGCSGLGTQVPAWGSASIFWLASCQLTRGRVEAVLGWPRTVGTVHRARPGARAPRHGCG